MILAKANKTLNSNFVSTKTEACLLQQQVCKTTFLKLNSRVRTPKYFSKIYLLPNRIINIRESIDRKLHLGNILYRL